MADPGTFEFWMTAHITFVAVPPLSGDTGDMEAWIAGDKYWKEYAKAQEADVTGVTGRMMRGLV